MTRVPVFPPLMTGLAAGPSNPFVIACDQARRGVDAGLLTWSISDERLRAALVLAPEVPLDRAMAGVIACAVGLQNALGTLAPPETAVHLDWPGGARLNGAHCGGLHVACETRDPGAVPGWLVVAIDLTLQLPPDWEPGDYPDRTALDQEGCKEIDPVELLEAWARHSLLWLSTLEEDKGRADLAREWQALAWNLGGAVTVASGGTRLAGTFLGADEHFGMLMKTPEGQTRLIPLSHMIEEV